MKDGKPFLQVGKNTPGTSDTVKKSSIKKSGPKADTKQKAETKSEPKQKLGPEDLLRGKKKITVFRKRKDTED